jgi:hypothetical protein
MTKAKVKAKAIRMPGKKRPAASRSPIQRPPPAEPHHRNLTRYTKPSDSQPIRPAAEGLDHRFLRSLSGVNYSFRSGGLIVAHQDPAPRHRPWITPKGATPAERILP